MKKMILQILNLVTLLIAIGVNYFINARQNGGASISEISDKYANLLTPADYAFGIWGLVYLALVAFAVYQLRDMFIKNATSDIVLKIGWWFVIANLANASWGIAFRNEDVGLSLLIMIILFFSLIKIVLSLNMEKWDAPISTIAFVWWPLSIYFGWITVALVANTATYLTALGWSGSPLHPATWAIIVLLLAGIVFIAMIWTRNMREYALAGVWGIVAIGVKNWGSNQLVAYVSIIMAFAIFINITAHAYKNRGTLPLNLMKKN